MSKKREREGGAAGSWYDRILGRAEGALGRIVGLRRALHRVPELGLDLPETSAIVEEELARLGLRARRAGSGLWADVGGGGPLVALRADMDALPVDEATGADYASERPGRMHACGHDAHAACLLGVAALLAEDERAGELPFRARLIFQPGEEGHYGARGLIEAGALDGVAAIAAGHVGDLSRELAPGQAGFLHGPMMAAADRFEGAFVGSGGHGSAPDRSPDPISAFAEYLIALNAFRARELDQSRPAVVSVCAVSAGSTHNVIPERADFKGTARSLHPDIRAEQARRIGEIGRAVAGMRGLRFEYRWEEGYPPLVNDVRASRAGMRAAAAALGEAAVAALTLPIMGGEDFSYYLERVPGFFWFLNTQAPDRGIVHPNHNPRFDLDEARLPAFVAVMASSARALAEEFGAPS